MTIGIGTITKKSLIVGTDSLWSFGEDFVKDIKTSKFVKIPNKYKDQILIASSGQDKFTQILEKLFRTNSELLDFTDKSGIAEIAEILQIEVSKLGIGSPDTDQLPDHELEFLIASKTSKSVFIISGDYSIMEFGESEFACIGSGSLIGESAMLALSKAKVIGKEALKISLETAMECHPMCGGRIEIREILLG